MAKPIPGENNVRLREWRVSVRDLKCLIEYCASSRCLAELELGIVGLS